VDVNITAMNQFSIVHQVKFVMEPLLKMFARYLGGSLLSWLLSS